MKKPALIAIILFSLFTGLESCAPYTGLRDPYKSQKHAKPMVSAPQPAVSVEKG